jgi:hypothetical protein
MMESRSDQALVASLRARVVYYYAVHRALPLRLTPGQVQRLLGGPSVSEARAAASLVPDDLAVTVSDEGGLLVERQDNEGAREEARLSIGRAMARLLRRET